METRIAIWWLILGGLCYLSGWLGHGSRIPPRVAGQLHVSRHWLRLMLRLGAGPIRLQYLLIQCLALAAFARAAVIGAGRPAALESLTRTIWTLAIAVLGVGTAWVYLRERGRND
jgi:predicted membrane channel-forming protein YqfA (hemolysin III family)